MTKPTTRNQKSEMYQRQISQIQSKSSSDQAKEAARKKGKPFCKVCFDAKKSESEYMSHYLKSAPGPGGKVVCPTLLNQSCLTCGQRGHTSSYCDKRTPSEPSEPSKPSEPYKQIPNTMTMTVAEKKPMPKNVPPLLKPEFPSIAPKSQFWWQDE